MPARRRRTMAAALGTLAGAPLARRAGAQRFPGRPIRFIAPYAPGGGIDTTARLLAGPMGASLGQPLVVENRSGAGGALGAADLARSAPDGHTIMVDASAHVVNPALLTNLSLDDATAFAPISQVVLFPLLLIVGNAVPVRTVQEFVAHLRGATRPPAAPAAAAPARRRARGAPPPPARTARRTDTG
jgi:tripartite-type tricarboxylate transporter receptor subunit TctC